MKTERSADQKPVESDTPTAPRPEAIFFTVLGLLGIWIGGAAGVLLALYSVWERLAS